MHGSKDPRKRKDILYGVENAVTNLQWNKDNGKCLNKINIAVLRKTSVQAKRSACFLYTIVLSLQFWSSVLYIYTPMQLKVRNVLLIHTCISTKYSLN